MNRILKRGLCSVLVLFQGAVFNAAFAQATDPAVQPKQTVPHAAHKKKTATPLRTQSPAPAEQGSVRTTIPMDFSDGRNKPHLSSDPADTGSADGTFKPSIDSSGGHMKPGMNLNF